MLEIADISGGKLNVILENIEEIINIVPPARSDETIKLWQTWKFILKELYNHQATAPTPLGVDFDNLQIVLNYWGMLYLELYEKKITPYMHIVICHSVSLMKKMGSLNFMSQQGFEACHKYHKLIYERCTSRGGGKHKMSSIEQTILFHYRVLFLQMVHKHDINLNEISARLLIQL